MKRKRCLLLCFLLFLMHMPTQAQPENMINVKDAPYGAKGDGMTDDTDAIVRAINASGANDTVYFPKGAYLLSAGLRPKSDTILMGESKEESILRYTYLPAPWGSLIYGGGEFDSPLNTKNIELHNFTVDGNLIESENGRALCFSYTSGIYIHDMIIENIGMPTAAVNFRTYVTDSVIENNEIRNIAVGSRYGQPIVPGGGFTNGVGIQVAWYSERINIRDNIIQNTARNGIGCNNSARYLNIRKNTISGTGINNPDGEALGLELWQDCDYAIVEDNQVDTWMSLVRSKYMAVRRNRVQMPEGSAFRTADPYGYELHSIGSVYTDNVSVGHAEGLAINGMDPEQLLPSYNYFGNNSFTGAWGFGGHFFASMQGGNFCQYFYNNDFSNTRKDIYTGQAGANVALRCNTRNYTFEACKFNNGRLGILLNGEPGLDGLYLFDSEIKNNTASGAPHYVEPGGAMTKTYQPSSGPAMTAFEITNTVVSGNEDNGLHPTVPFSSNPPNATFSIPKTVRAGEPVQFVSGTEDACETASYLWDFGAGLPSMSAKTEYTYETPGVYPVTLIVWDTNGRASRVSHTITVEPPLTYTVTGVQTEKDGTVHATFRTNAAGSQTDQIIAAAYAPDGSMLDYTMADAAESGAAVTLQLSLSPECTNYEVRVFVWNMDTALIPLSNAVSSKKID